MKETPKTKLLAALALTTIVVFSAQGALILQDNYNVSNTNSGFAVGSGVNSGINPPTTRLTGSAAAGLRYYKYAGDKADTAHLIQNNKFRVNRIASDSSTISLTPGTGLYDFSTALNTGLATPENPAVYELTIKISNGAASNQRCSFAVTSTAGVATAWDFAIQLYHANTADTAYTLQKRIGATSATGGTAVNAAIAQVGTYSGEVSFLIRVTDAGAETSAFNSRVQVSTDGGATWIYDTSSDPDISNQFRFSLPARFIYWDVAGGAGPVTYDDFSLNWISGPTSTVRTWTGGGADDNWSTAANWDSGVPGSGDRLIFDGTTRQANVNDLSGLIFPWVAFNHGGFTLSGAQFTINSAITNTAGTNILTGDLNLGTTGAKTWSIAAGSELTLNNITTVEMGGDHGIVGGGTLRLKGVENIGVTTTANPAMVVNEGTHIVDGGTFISRGGYRIGSQATGAGAQTILTNGAAFTLTASGGNLRVGDSTNANTANLVVDHSTLTMSGAILGLPYAAGATGAVSQVGGVVSGAVLSYNASGAGRGTYTIQGGGVLDPIQIKKNTSGGQSIINFNNAILRASPGASNAFFTGLNTAQIQAGGLTLDALTDVVIGQRLTGTGGLTKSNNATVTLTAANTYSGPTVIQSGQLVLPTIQTNATTVTVADGAQLGVSVINPGTTLSVSGLNFAGTSFGVLNFDLGSSGTPTAPLLKVTSLSVSGPVLINVANGLQLTPGQFPLVTYSGTIAGGFQFTLGTLPPGVSATLVDNTANSSIDLNITGVPGYIWTGAVSGDWDYSTQNWIDSSSSPATFADGFPATFLDGAATGLVNLAAFPSPSVVTVSNEALPYVFTGGALTTPLLRKNGAGTLTRIDGEADLIGTIELNGGAFIVTNFFDATFTTMLTDAAGGSGVFVKQGDSKLTMLSTNSSFDGGVLIQGGTVKLGNDHALGSTASEVTIASGATLDLNDAVPGAEPVVVSGAGVGGQGAIIDSAVSGSVDTNLRDVTLAGDTTFGSPSGTRWDIRIRNGVAVAPGLKGNGHNLTKVGPGYVSIASQRSLGANTPYWHMNLGDVIINEGTLAIAESVTLDNPAAALTVNPGAGLQLYDLGWTNPVLRTITLSDARLMWGGGPDDTNVLTGGIQLSGANTFNGDQANLIVNSAVTGSGSVTLTANATGTLTLNGANTFTGSLVVSNGTLAGTGSLAGDLINYGGTNAPGFAGVTDIATFTVNGNLTLASGATTVLELNRNLTPNSDRLVAGGALAFGGRLNVVLGPGAPAPQAGDVYQLFSKAGSGAFSAVTLPALTAGRTWDTSNLTVDGTIKVVGPSTPPTITGIVADGGNLVLNGTGGTAGGGYIVLTSPNAAAPLASWTPVATNTFGAGGSFSYTNSLNPSTPAAFFRLQVQ